MSITQAKLLSAIGDLDPNNPWSIIGPTFDKIEIAESVIAKTRARHPAHEKAIWNSFSLLMPGKLLYEAPEPLYRAHCAELLERVCKGLDTTLGTKAEITMTLAKTSLRSPLTHTAAVLYAQLFRELLPRTPVAAEIAQLTTLAFDRDTESLLADLAQDARVPGRKLKEKTKWHDCPSL